jgi:hypothetical protein
MAAAVSLAFRLLGIDSGAEEALNRVSEHAEGVRQRLGGIGTAGVAAGGVLAGGFAAAVSDALDIQPAINQMNAQLGATGAQGKQYGAVAGKLYAQAYGESMEEVTDAVKDVVQNIGGMSTASSADLQSVGAAAFNVSKIMGEEVGPTTVAVGQMIKTGMAKNAQEAFDILAAGAQKGGNKAQDLLDTFNEYSTQFRKMGLDGKDAMGLISQGLQGGARDADLVADAIKEFSIRAIDGSTSTADGFQKIGLSASAMSAQIGKGGPAAKAALDTVIDRLNAMTDPVARNTAGTELFGTQWEDLGGAFKSLDVSSAVGALGQVDGAAARAGKTLNDNAKTHLTEFKRQAEMALVNVLGNQVVPVITRVTGVLANDLGPALSRLGGWLRTAGGAAADFGRWVDQNRVPVTIIAGIITTLLLPALIALGVQATTAGAAQVAAWAMSAAGSVTSGAAQLASLTMTGLRWIATGATALLAGAQVAAAWLLSVAPIALAVAAVAAAVFFIIKYWDDIKAGISAATHWVLDFLRNNWPLLVSILGGPIGAAAVQIYKHWSDIKNGAASVFDFFKGLPGRLGSVLAGVGNIIYGPFKAGFNAIASAWNNSVGRIGFKAPSWVPGFGGKGWSVPKIPMLAAGGLVGAAGLALVGERGPELLQLPRGAAVTPLPAQRGQAGPTQVNVTVPVTVMGAVSTARGIADDLITHIVDALHHHGVTNGGVIPRTNIRIT